MRHWLLRNREKQAQAAWMLYCPREFLGFSGTESHTMHQEPWTLTWKTYVAFLSRQFDFPKSIKSNLSGLHTYRLCPSTDNVPLFCSGLLQSLAQSFWPLRPHWFLSFTWRICDIDVPFMAEHYTDIYFPQQDQFWVSVLTNVHCSEKFIWWGLRDVLIYGHRGTHLKNSLKSWPFNKMTIYVNPWRQSLPTMGSWMDLQH